MIKDLNREGIPQFESPWEEGEFVRINS